jgi:hypothetical protein
MISALTLVTVGGVAVSLLALLIAVFKPSRAWRIGLLGVCLGILASAGMAALAPGHTSQANGGATAGLVVPQVVERTIADGTTVERTTPVTSLLVVPKPLQPLASPKRGSGTK